MQQTAQLGHRIVSSHPSTSNGTQDNCRCQDNRRQTAMVPHIRTRLAPDQQSTSDDLLWAHRLHLPILIEDTSRLMSSIPDRAPAEGSCRKGLLQLAAPCIRDKPVPQTSKRGEVQQARCATLPVLWAEVTPQLKGFSLLSAPLVIPLARFDPRPRLSLGSRNKSLRTIHSVQSSRSWANMNSLCVIRRSNLSALPPARWHSSPTSPN